MMHTRRRWPPPFGNSPDPRHLPGAQRGELTGSRSLPGRHPRPRLAAGTADRRGRVEHPTSTTRTAGPGSCTRLIHWNARGFEHERDGTFPAGVGAFARHWRLPRPTAPTSSTSPAVEAVRAGVTRAQAIRTNMAKASLNMLTRTSAKGNARDRQNSADQCRHRLDRD
jgi:hypothetical protein